MAGMQTYQVISPTGVVVDDAGQSLTYQAGAVFNARPSNPSIQRLVRARAITMSQQATTAPTMTPNVPVGQGPPGPAGPPGGPAGSMFSVKVRSNIGTYPLVVPDSGAVELVRFPQATQALYDPSHMFSLVQPDRVVVKPGAGGRYHVEFAVRFMPHNLGFRLIQIDHCTQYGALKDQVCASVPSVMGGETALSVSHDFDANSNDLFRCMIRQTSGLPLNVWVSFSAMLQGSGPQGAPGPAGPCMEGSDDPQVLASNKWLAAHAKLASLPPVTTPDPYAAIRARLTAERAQALTDATDLGGLI